MTKDFHQTTWTDQLRDDWLVIVRLAICEDLGEMGDCTTEALVPEDSVAAAAMVVRQAGVVAGLAGVEMTLREIEPKLAWRPDGEDGDAVAPGDRIGRIEGPVRGILSSERIVLNFVGHLSGVATLTRRYVDAVAGTNARVYDTRKTTPGWRRLEKYAVRCGGGRNHRSGLFDAVLIKDNHLASGCTPAEAVQRARSFLADRSDDSDAERRPLIVEIEVDTLEQLDEVLPAGPDIVLLDNMTPDELRQAVARRDAVNAAVELEASGGVNLQTVAAIAASGVDRISVGALTHSASCLDVGLDWLV